VPRSRRAERSSADAPRKGERREGQILDALHELLRTTPFVELTIDDIAREAGISRSALYFYFGSKEEVLGGLHHRTYESMGRTTEPITDGLDADFGAMHAAIQQVVAEWRDDGHALRTFHEAAAVSEEFAAVWRPRLEQHVDLLAAIIERERQAGRAAPSPPTARAIASAWFWMLEAQCYELFRRDHTDGEEVELVDTLTRLWLRAIGAPAPG
jgi:AcrR family transcriptional regulator